MGSTMSAADFEQMESGAIDHTDKRADEMRAAFAAIRDISDGGAAAEGLRRIAKIALDALPLNPNEAKSDATKRSALKPAQPLYRMWESAEFKR
jgi:hypothetical protein